MQLGRTWGLPESASRQPAGAITVVIDRFGDDCQSRSLPVARQGRVRGHNDGVNLEFLVPMLAAAASAVGILVALDQITAVARLRRQILFWNGLRVNKPLPSDAEAFQSLERSATAKIIAFQALPAWRLILPAFAVLAGITTAWQSGYVFGRIPSAEVFWDKFREVAFGQGLDTPFLIMVPVIFSMGVFGWINVLVARSRLSKAYLDGENLDLEEVSIGSDNWPALRVLGGRGSLQVLICSVGFACLAAQFGAVTGMRDVNAPLPWPTWMGFLLMGGVFASTAGLPVYAKVAYETKTPWKHPRPLNHRTGKLPKEPRRSFTGRSSVGDRRTSARRHKE